MRKRFFAALLLLAAVVWVSCAGADWTDDWQGFGISPLQTLGEDITVKVMWIEGASSMVIRVCEPSLAVKTETKWTSEEALPETFEIPAVSFSEKGLYSIWMQALDEDGKSLRRSGWVESVYIQDPQSPLPTDQPSLCLSGATDVVRSGNELAFLWAPGAADAWFMVDGKELDGQEVERIETADGIACFYYPMQDKAGVVAIQGFARDENGSVMAAEAVSFESTSAGALQEIRVESPASVGEGENFTFTVYPATNVNEPENNVYYNVYVQDMDENWHLVFEAMNERELDPGDGEECLLTEPKDFTVYADISDAPPDNDCFAQDYSLIPGHHYSLRLEAFSEGYDATVIEQRFFVCPSRESALRFTINGKDESVDVEAGEEVSVRVKAPEDVTALRIVWEAPYWIDIPNLWSDGGQLERSENGFVSLSMRFGEARRYAAYVQAYRGELPSTENREAWEQLEWESATSNVIALNVTGRGQIDLPELSAPENVYWGDFLPVSVASKPEGATRIELYAVSYIGGKRREYSSVEARLPQDPEAYPLTVNYPTLDLDADSVSGFTLEGEFSGPGYENRRFVLPFRLNSASLTDGVTLQVSTDKSMRSESVIFQGSAVNARSLELFIHPLEGRKDEILPWRKWENTSFFIAQKEFDEAGSYEVFVRATYENGDEEESERVRVSVGTLGVLTAATIANAPQTLKQSDGPLTFRVNGLVPDAPYANWRYWEIRVEDLDAEVQDENGKHPKTIARITRDDADLDEGGGRDVTVPWKSGEVTEGIEVGHTYQICTWVDAGGYTGSDSFWQFFAYDSQTEDVVLKIYDQEGNEATELPASSLFTIEISAPGADEVEFFNGEEWREAERNSYDPKTDTYSFGYSHNSGTVSYFARARFGEEWTGISNIVTVTFVSQGMTEAVTPLLPPKVIRDGIPLGEQLPVTFPAAENPDAPNTAFMFITSIQEVRPDGRREGTPVMAFIPVPDRNETYTPKLSTEDLTPGRTYVVAVETAADGFDRSYTESEPFTVYSLGETPAVTPTLSKTTLKQGEMLKVTIPAKADDEDIATRFYSYVTDSSDEWREHEFSTDWDLDYNPERGGDYSYTVGTGDLEPGNYVLVLESRAPGYAMSRTKVAFTIEKLGEGETLFSFEEADPYIASVGYGIYVRAPGAKRIVIYKHKLGEEEPWEERSEDGDTIDDGIGFDSGTYTIFAKAWYEGGDEDGVEIGRVTVTVEATGSIAPPTLFPKSETVFTLSESFEGFAFEVALPEGQQHQNWELTLEDKTNNWRRVWEARGDNWDRWEEIAGEWTIPADVFVAGHSYDLVARLWQRGCDTAETRISLLVQDPESVSEDLKLLVGPYNDITHTEYELPNAYDVFWMNIILPEDKYATILEVFDGEEWRNPDELDMNNKREFMMRASENGVYSYVARAVFDPIEDWENVDWENLNWVQSKPVTVTVGPAEGALEEVALQVGSVILESDFQENGLVIAWNPVVNAEDYYLKFDRLTEDGFEWRMTRYLDPESLIYGITTIAPMELEDVLEAGSLYRLSIEAYATGWKPSMSEAYFAVIDSAKILRLPAGLTAVGENAFAGSDAQAVIFAKPATIGDGAFGDCGSLCVVVAPEEMADQINPDTFPREPIILTPSEWNFGN